MKTHIRFNANGEFGTQQDETYKTYCGRPEFHISTVSHAKSVSDPNREYCQACIKARDSKRNA